MTTPIKNLRKRLERWGCKNYDIINLKSCGECVYCEEFENAISQLKDDLKGSRQEINKKALEWLKKNPLPTIGRDVIPGQVDGDFIDKKIEKEMITELIDVGVIFALKSLGVEE